MSNYHILGVLERNGQRQAIDQHLAADNASAAIELFENDGWYWVSGKVTVLRLPCVDSVLYERQVALGRAEISDVMAKPGQMTQMELFPREVAR
jgi:hypothetical protein